MAVQCETGTNETEIVAAIGGQRARNRAPVVAQRLHGLEYALLRFLVDAMRLVEHSGDCLVGNTSESTYVSHCYARAHGSPPPNRKFTIDPLPSRRHEGESGSRACDKGSA